VIYPIIDNVDGEGNQLINWMAEIQQNTFAKNDWNKQGNLDDFHSIYANWKFDWLDVGEMIKKLTGENIMYQNVAYLMRSGPPDAMDMMVGTNYGTLAADLLMAGQYGRMVALVGGKYTSSPLDEVGGGARLLDVSELYDPEQYRPHIRNVAGKPMFLY